MEGLNQLDLHFLKMAKIQGEKSSFSNSKHGAILAHGNRIVAVGVNSHLKESPGAQTDSEKYVATLNAEIVAVSAAIRANIPLDPLTLYSTNAPNWATFKSIVALGIKRIVHYSPDAPERTKYYARELNIELISVG